MNILFLHSSSDIYGASKILLYTIETIMSQKTNSKCYVILSDDGPLVDDLKNLGCKVFIFNLGILRKKYNNIFGIVNRVIKILFALSFILRFVKKNEVEIIYSNTTAVIVGAFASLFTKAKHIYHVHEIISSPKHLKILLQLLLKYASDKNIMVSNAVLMSWARNDEKLKNNSVVVYNGIDIQREIALSEEDCSELPKCDCLIGMIGRVHYWKGQIYFLQIVSEVIKEVPNAKFLMIGDAYPGYEYLYLEIKEQKDRLDLNNVVFDLGFQKRPNKYLKKFDLLVLPSILPDPFPTVILESMCLSVPVVATAHGGALEMIENDITGWHIPFNDHKKSAKIIIDILKNKDFKKIGINGRQKIESEFSLDSFKRNILESVSEVGLI